MNIAILAFVIDTIIGDPRTKLHPVVLIGRLISFLERIYYRREDGNQRKFFNGAILVLLVLFITYDVAAGIIYLAYYIPWEWGVEAVEALLLAFTISPKSLAKAGRGIYALLLTGEIDKARKAVGWIVGRDTEHLDEAEIARATVETIAENTVDGVIAPLFFFVLGGVPLAFLYRAANTMDSMLGYKNEKYLYFGRAAAKLDDVLNYIPARITGLLFVMAAMLLGFDAHNALQMMRRDASKHPSPNGGYAEATMAGALHIRLGGVNSYFGKKTFRAYMGEALEATSPKHIMESIRMMYTATVLFLIFAYALLKFMGY
ncbi:MAG: Cobalamin biosynthesis protein CobD [Mitsuokella multacida]